MPGTVVIVSRDGRLMDVMGSVREADAHYSKFAARLLGEDGAFATLDYGWNGKTKLRIAAASGTGEQIVLDAQEIAIPGDLTIGGVPLQDLMDSRVDLELEGLRGAEGEITVARTPADEGSGSSDEPRNLYTIGLDRHFLDRIDSIEAELENLIRMDDVYYAGDGLTTDRESYPHVLSVNLGTGLKFEDPEPPESSGSASDSPEYPEPRLLAVDCIDAVEEGSKLPVTSGAVYAAIGGPASRYVVKVESASGNMVLYDNEED